MGLDSSSTYSQIDGTLVIGDGTNSLTADFVQSDISWTEEGSSYTEAKSRNKHKTTPVLRKTAEGNITGSLSLLITSFRGNTAITPYEVFTRTGLGASWGNTAVGDKKASRLALTLDNTAASGGAQTATFGFVVFTSVKVDPAGGDGLYLLTADFTDHEEAPTWS